MPFDIQEILAQATNSLDTEETERVAAAVADRVAKLKKATDERVAEAEKYTKKLEAFNAEIALATTPAQAIAIVNKKAYTVKFLHLND